MYQGASVHVVLLDDSLVEICFDRRGDTINKFDDRTIGELRQAVTQLAADRSIRGVLVTSAKQSFIVGADINGFAQLFSLPQAELIATNTRSNRVFQDLESLPVPVVVAINGFALGGGLEAALAADYRVVASDAQLGLPEVKLGLLPGFGGTVRLPRIAGIEAAIQWITSGGNVSAQAALRAGVADEVVSPGDLREASLRTLRGAVTGDFDWKTRRVARAGAVNASGLDVTAIFASTREVLARRGPRHQPAALTALDLLERSLTLDAHSALMLEAEAFAKISQTQAASSLVQIFLNEQQVKKAAKRYAGAGHQVRRVAVIGAGIMGGGIAYTSASRGKVPVRMKDISPRQLDLGMAEATSLVQKQVSAGRLEQVQAEAVLALIAPQMNNEGFDAVDVVVEAVVENLSVKHGVLRELETTVRADAVIASNTSSLRIDDLAAPLARPENFAGMHFFNPVPVMPLVEVIRGSRTNDAAIGTIVSYAQALGKIPIVVRDGPGFLVNRILTPYMQAFAKLLDDGADYEQVDAAMEAFGWPMGPAYLNDVVGMDTGLHVADTICAGFPERLHRTWKDPLQAMVANGRLGQKNGKGFYRYESGAGGKPKKFSDPAAREILRQIVAHAPRSFAHGEIVERMMLPLMLEAARCLEEGVVDSPAELDMALVLGVGFPTYLGGALKYADWLGLSKVVELSDRYAQLGPQYVVTRAMRAMAQNRQKYY